ncbi:PIN domain-containing protein [Paucibacter sp. TC2R-5]|uniref:PIN domain-containing protein n=1 Tax=Paucibacter sp. TC2R-5 TaxID=2893555 RepID=UPI0021E486A5|nr:PIN domain-containing protein [Paucibacter sp. TC2R-5]MCV2357497.1 PIN domain-containing protein [Paucibacter sp. TC2R-5]
MNALIDTALLIDYLRGEPRAAAALDICKHRSISVVTWLEVMSCCPPDLQEATRGFLRSFERLSISEAIADEALKLAQEHAGLGQERALTWATASINQLMFVTTEAIAGMQSGRNVTVPYAAPASVVPASASRACAAPARPSARSGN